jgi:hypothetical protein
MSRGSARTLKHWLDLGYDNVDAERMRLSRTPGTLEYFMILKGMDENEAIVAKEKYQSNRANTFDNFISKYGIDEGEKLWEIYKQKQAYSNSYEYKRDKYGWSIDEYISYNKSRGVVGELNGNYGKSYYEVWVNKYGKDEADRMNKLCGIKKARVGIDNGNYKRPKRSDEIEKMRDSAIARVIRQGTYTSYNPNSIPIIEKYGMENGYIFQHAENSGEYHIPNTRFMVDGYDIKNNVVIEFDENYHTNEVQQKKDLQRQEQIGIELKCKFIRINETLEVKIFDYSK